MKYTLIYFLIIIGLCTCKNAGFVKENADVPFTIADSRAAAVALLKEDTEGFFSKLQAIDVAIQLKDNAFLNDRNYVDNYRKFLKNQATAFSVDDTKAISEIATEALALIQKVNPSIGVKFQLCKIKTTCYGDDVYFTRGNAIFIPENIFADMKKAEQVPVMLHEIWHILSEEKPKLKEEMYGLIGFVKHHKAIQYPAALKKMMLTNPDGADDDYGIVLKGDKKALPVILSGKQKFDAANPSFFNHLRFEIFGLDAAGNIEMNSDLTSQLSNEAQASFFSNIKDNTQYIIHPDEIIADNFMLAVLAYNNNDYSQFNKEGKKLIDQVLAILKKN